MNYVFKITITPFLHLRLAFNESELNQKYVILNVAVSEFFQIAFESCFVRGDPFVITSPNFKLRSGLKSMSRDLCSTPDPSGN